MYTKNARSIDEIDNEIIKLKASIDTIPGRECEVYTRIVGYYRPVKNWNKGKRAELDKRIYYKMPEVVK